MRLTRYWFEFADLSESTIHQCFGVTAWTHDDAISLLSRLIPNWKQFQLNQIISNVDISTLDTNHVRPNMGVCTVRGIWFPIGY
jgi:hypothetical protein